MIGSRLSPALHKHFILIHECQRSHGNPIVVLGQVLADRRQAVEALDAAVGERLEAAFEDGVGGEEAEDSVEHDVGVGVGGGELGGEVGGGDEGAGAGFLDELEQVELDGGFEDHGQNGGAC